MAGSVSAAEGELEQRVGALLDSGQIFMAQDLAAEGLKEWPQAVRLRVLFALALIRTGAVGEAVAALRPLLARVDTRPLATAHAALRRAVALAEGPAAAGPGRRRGGMADAPDAAAIEAMAELVDALEAVRDGGLRRSRIEPGLLGELGELHLEAWQGTGDRALLETASALLEESFDQSADPRAGAAAATALHLLDRPGDAAALAARVLAEGVGRDSPSGRARDTAETAFRTEAARGLAALLTGNPTLAVERFAAGLELLGQRSPLVVPPLRLARRLRAAGLAVPDEVDAILKPPGVVVFTGHMLDAPGAEIERFPPRAEAALRAEIARRLERMDVQIGYSGAACGSELLFVEALLERDGEANIVLPFAVEDYVRTAVGFAGPRWEQRFRNAMRLSHSVVYATREPWLGHEQLFRFQNQMLHGLATLRAEFLETAPNLLAVWDMMEGSLAAGAADFIDQWADITRLQIVDIDEVRMAVDADGTAVAVAPRASVPPPAPPPAPVEPQRTIRAMLFADLVGYSKLGEADIPRFMRFLERISTELAEGLHMPEVINTWGDAVFAVMPKATDLARFAFALRAAVRKHGSGDPEAGIALDIRISLHAGPVFAGRDPFNDRPNFFGSHINRAARLEPVTVPGHIYATQQFVALMTAEESQSRYEAESVGEPWSPAARCSYVGVMSLAKNFGKDAVYHVQPA